MKRIIRIIACLAFLVPISISTQSFISPDPAPNETYFYFYPNQWWDTVNERWEDYYDLKYSVYGISESPYVNLQEGPYYPDEMYNSNLLAQHFCEYTTNTYATIWAKKLLTSSWVNLGSIYMSQGNVLMLQGSDTWVYKFYINMDDIPSA